MRPWFLTAAGMFEGDNRLRDFKTVWTMGYADQRSIEKGLRFRTRSGLVVQTTGSTTHVESTNVYVHEVEIVEDPSQGNKFLHNLDYAEPTE
jgi:hypothetical protein